MMRKARLGGNMMFKRGVVTAVFLFGALGAMNAAHAQISMTRSQADPANKLFRMVAPDGTIVAADGETRRFFIETPGGASFEFTFDQALAAAESNPSERIRLKADFEAALADAKLANYSYAYRRELGPCQPPPGKIFCEIQPFAAPTPNQSAFADPPEDDEDEETHDLDKVSVTARRPNIMTGGAGSGWGYRPGGIVYGNPHSGGSAEAEQFQRCWAEDYDDFKSNRADSCFTANVTAATTIGLMFIAGDACLLAGGTLGGGGVTLAGCGGAVIVYVVSLVSAVHYDNKCLAEYTAPAHCQ
ncbi:hypothetical protein [Lysobacter sp. A378]